MDKDSVMEIIAVQESASTDEEYLQLYADYSCAQDKFCCYLQEMPPLEREILENFLLTSVALHQRLMELAINYGKSLGR